MNLAWPQLTYLAILMLGVGIALAEHGKPKTGTQNAWFSIIGAVICIFLLSKGGFFAGGAL